LNDLLIVTEAIMRGNFVERGCSMVGSVPCVRKVAGSNPTLAATYGPCAHTVACSASAC